MAAQIEKPGERHAQEQVPAIAKQPDKSFAARVDEAIVRVALRLIHDKPALVEILSQVCKPDRSRAHSSAPAGDAARHRADPGHLHLMRVAVSDKVRDYCLGPRLSGVASTATRTSMSPRSATEPGSA